MKKKWTIDDSIQWVIDSLDNTVIERRERENHKYDEVRADIDLYWCPHCRCKWEIYEGKLWSSPDRELWKRKVCKDCIVK